MHSMRSKSVKYLLSVIVSAGILWLLLQSVKPDHIVKTLSGLNKSLLPWFAICYAGIPIFRTLRYRALFGSAIPFGKLFGIVNIYNFLNEFLPFRSGELVYLYMIKKAGVPAGKNVSSLIVVRLFDFMMVIVLGFGALGVLLSQGLHAFGIEKYVWLFPVILTAGLVAFALFLRFTNPIVSFFLKPLRRIQRLQHLIQKVEHLALDIVEALREHMNRKTLIKIILTSLGVWVSATVSYWLIFVSLGVPLTLLQMFFVIAFPALALIVPVQGIAHVGTFEAPVIAGFLAVGIDKQIALASSVSGHVVIFALAIVSGLVGITIASLQSRGSINVHNI